MFNTTKGQSIAISGLIGSLLVLFLFYGFYLIGSEGVAEDRASMASTTNFDTTSMSLFNFFELLLLPALGICIIISSVWYFAPRGVQ